MADHWTPADFTPPARLVCRDFHLRWLTIHDLIKDYDAVMSSTARLQGVFYQSDWPEGLSLEQNLIDLAWHQKEYQRGSSYAYTVMAPDESICLGCVYLYPASNPDYDAEVLLWVRSSHARLDSPLYQAVRHWVEEHWPFTRVAYPSRSISWQEYMRAEEPDTGS